jgi:hypothetical protein
MSLILAYYAFWIGLVWFLLGRYPGLAEYMPVGRIGEITSTNMESFEPVYTMVERNLLSPSVPLRLLIAAAGSGIMTVPVSWVYFITSRARRIDQSFLQTIMILPIVVTGIAMIVVNSLALAFSLAGVVAAVRFRFTLNQPSDAMYIFVAIGIGLGSGIGALGVAAVISFTYVIATLVIWKLEYGKSLSGPFLTMMTRRDGGEDDY